MITADDLSIDSLWLGADLVTMQGGKYQTIEDGALAVKSGKLVWLGPRKAMPAFTAREQHQLPGGIITPGLVDCHTHLVFGGDRSQEFEQRLNGASYAEIAAQGGGILSTVRATRAASQSWLHQRAGGWIVCWQKALLRLRSNPATALMKKASYACCVQFAS